MLLRVTFSLKVDVIPENPIYTMRGDGSIKI